MKNLFKKLLACCMAVCMVLTLCVGAITVSAEAATGTVTAGTANIYTTDANAVVDVTAYAAGGIAAAEINVAVPANLSIAKLELATTDANVEVTYASAADPSGAPEVLDSNATASEVAPNVIDGVFTYIIHLPANTVTTAEVTVKITFAGTFAEGTTVVDVVDAEACYDANSDLIDLTIVDGAIVATVPHVCTAGEAVVEKNVDPTCTETGSYDEVVYCTGCGEEMSRKTVTVNALGHAWGEGEVTTAPDCENAGVRTFTCANDPAHTKTEAIDALGHNPGEPAEENRVEAQPGVAGSYDMVVRCTVCNAIISSESFEIPALPVGPAVDTTLVAAGAGVGFAASSLQINFRVRKTVIQKYDKVELIIVPDKYDSNFNLVENPAEVVADLVLNGNFYTFAYTDMPLYSLGLNIKYFFRAYNAADELVAVSEDFNITPAGQLKTLYSQNASNPEMLTLITDVLVVGDEAAKMYKAQKPESDLANAPSIIEGFDISKATADVPECNTIDTFNAYDSRFGTASTATFQAAKSAAIGTAPYINLRIKDKNAKLDVSKFSVRISYSTQSLSGPITTYDKTISEGFTKSGQFITFAFREVSFCDSNKDLLIEVMYEGAKVYDITYSIESYLNANTSNASIGGTATALLKLGASARALSAKNASK